MATTLRFSPIRTEIAGVPVDELARQFGTPTYVYDAAKIVERIADLRAFDVIRYAQKACSNLAILDLVRRHGVLVDAVSAGEIRRALAAGYPPAGDPPPIVYTADIFDREALDLVVAARHPRQLRLARHDRPARQRVPRAASITLRINPGFGHGHSQKTNTGGEQSKHGIWHDAARRLPAPAPIATAWRVTGLHMHIGSGTDLEHLAQVCGAMEQAAARGRAARSTTISAGGGLPIPYRAGQIATSISPPTSRCGTPRASGSKTRSATRCGWRSSRAATWWPRAATWSREIRAIKQHGRQHVLPARRRLQQSGPADPLRRLSSDVDRARPTATAERPLHDVVVGGPLCESGDIFTQEEGGFVCTRALPAAEVGELPGDRVRRRLRLRDGLELQQQAAGRRSADRTTAKPHLIRRRQTFEDLISRRDRFPSS